MANSKATKKALFMSMLSLLLCFTMLMGATFAWFTDTVTSKNNRIVAGNLDVDLVMYKEADGKYVSIAGGNGDIFSEATGNGINWEPGKTEIVYLGVKNLGSLALKYNILLDIVDGEIPLSGSLEYAIIDGAEYEADKYANWQAVKAAAGSQVAPMPTGTGLLAAENGTLDGVLTNPDVEEVEYFALAVHMKEEATNEYQNGSITIDVTVLATQLAAEFDSFNNTYDEEAPFGTYIELNAGDDLLAVMASAEADMPLTIKLNGDVEWPTDGHHGENDITPASSIVIDGNGNTITATGSGVTPLGDTEAPMTLKNVKIVDNSVSYNEAAWELSYLEIGGKSLNCVNVDFADPIQVVSDNATFSGCSFVGHYDKNSTSTTQYGVWVYNGNSTYTNCTFTGTRSMKICDEYAGEVGTVAIDSCTFNGISEKPGVCIDDEDTQNMNITIKNSTFINCKAGDQGLYIYETDNTVPTIENNTVLSNATFVSTKDELLNMSAKALTGNNGTAEEATIILDADIDMQNAEFSAIIAQRGDKLTIVGNGHKISNVKLVSGENDNTTGQASMFYAYPNSTLTVSNLTLENVNVTAEENGTGYAAAVVGYCEGNAILNNVDVVNATVTGVKSSGMLVGHLSGSLTAKDCDLSGTVTLADFSEEANGHYAGKYIGTLAGPATLTNCTAGVTVSGNLNAANVGDVFGRKTDAGSLN
ncbi:MAG: hypothetical protein IJF32_06580 [Oscillospiraceae bacterium]|nr:hypothetical protein [Oscillospiraceae bacterium]